MSALPELPRSIREIDDRAARDLDRLARMSERNQPNGSASVWVTGVAPSEKSSLLPSRQLMGR